MTDVSVDIFAEWRVVPEDVVTLSVFPSSSQLSVRSVKCSGIRFHQVVFGMEGQLGRMMLCLMRDDSCLLMLAGIFFVVIAFAMDVLECSVMLCEWLVGVVVKVKGDV